MRLVLIFVIVFLMVMQANADPRWHGGGHEGWHGDGGWHGGGYSNPLGGIIGGAIGGYLWRQWNQPQANEEWCAQRYHSYDPYTKTYLGYDGLRHGCP